MTSHLSDKIEFHPDAAARFQELAVELLKSVRSFGPAGSPRVVPNQLHAIANITPEDIIGEINVRQSSVNGLGIEVGRCWTSNGHRVGWEGPDFDSIKEIARKFALTGPLKGKVSDAFVLDEVFIWLQDTLNRKCTEELPAYIAIRCTAEIKDYELWVPLFRTYSTTEFKVGEVQFRTISPAMMDRFYQRVPDEAARRDDVKLSINRQRSRIQGGLAACVRIRAESKKAKEVAQDVSQEAIALLRFLSPVNWTCRLVSYCLPVGRESVQRAVSLFVENNSIKNISEGTIEQGPAGWNIDESRNAWNGLLESLDKLSCGRDETDFKKDLYGALQLHSRQSVAVEIPEKMLFVVAAIESLLLKNAFEPIQKNLGERMALLAGDSLVARKAILQNVEDFYRIRSDFFHHGQDVRDEDVAVIDKFFWNVWYSLVRLLSLADKYQTKMELISYLEDLKLS